MFSLLLVYRQPQARFEGRKGSQKQVVHFEFCLFRGRDSGPLMYFCFWRRRLWVLHWCVSRVILADSDGGLDGGLHDSPPFSEACRRSRLL